MSNSEAGSLLSQAVRSLEAKDRDGAAQALRDLSSRRVDIGDQWGAVARMTAAIGELKLADEAMRRFAARAPADAARATAHAALLAEWGRADEAMAVLNRLPRNAAASPPVLHLLGTLNSQLGRFGAAREMFTRTLAAWPLSGHSWLGLAAIHRYAEGDPELERLEKQREAMASAVPDARAAYLYALGKAYDDAGRVDEAFAAFGEGAALIRPTRRYDRAADASLVEAVIAGFGSETLKALAADPRVSTSRPIFVTGIPRSGTTLVEQMLASHSGVDGGGEINLFPHVLRQIGGGTAAAAQAFVAKSGGAAAAWREAAGLYLHLLDQRIPGERHAVDKTLSSSRSLGLISIILPEAPLVWVRRDPLDVAWSCFRTMFIRGVPWSWSLEDIAHHIRLEERLLAHWGEALGERLLVVEYEQLVSQPDEQAARIQAHCGLPEERLTDFDKTERAVTTSSAAQVRQPLYKSSMGAAERYREHLRPFIAAYEAQRAG